jgi:YD repeat-containing protein
MLCCVLSALGGIFASASDARAADGSNDACPAHNADADDVRETYDPRGRLVHQLRLKQAVVVEEVAITYTGDHPTLRTERTPGHQRIARSYFDGDAIVVGECHEDGQRTGYVSYRYADDHVTLMEKRTLGDGVFRVETTRYTYDPDGNLLVTEVRGPDGSVVSVTRAERPPAAVPVVLSLLGGGSYQSDTELYDFTAGLGIHRRPKAHRYGSDPVEVGLDAMYKFHRAAGVTSTDQTTLRFGVDYHDILPRITLFTFTATDRNMPANLRLNLEEAVLGIKFDLVPPGKPQLDVSFAPVWNFRSILAPNPTGGGAADETTSKLRGSLRARAGLHFSTWSLLDTFELLPTIFGDDVASEDDFWHRTVLRNTVTFDVTLTRRLSFHEEFKYTWDSAMRAQASCPDSENPLCLGYAFASTTALSVNLEL